MLRRRREHLAGRASTSGRDARNATSGVTPGVRCRHVVQTAVPMISAYGQVCSDDKPRREGTGGRYVDPWQSGVARPETLAWRATS